MNLLSDSVTQETLSSSIIILPCKHCKPAKESADVEVVRPPSPGNTQIWIEGNRVLNCRTPIYEIRESYWSLPYCIRAFVHSYPGIKKQKDEAINEYEVVGIYLYYS